MMKTKDPHFLGPDWRVPDWFTNKEAAVDLRLFFFYIKPNLWSECRWDFNDSRPNFYKWSYITKSQICYTIEASHYAQSAFFASIIVMQWADLIVSKTRSLSLG